MWGAGLSLELHGSFIVVLPFISAPASGVLVCILAGLFYSSDFRLFPVCKLGLGIISTVYVQVCLVRHLFAWDPESGQWAAISCYIWIHLAKTRAILTRCCPGRGLARQMQRHLRRQEQPWTVLLIADFQGPEYGPWEMGEGGAKYLLRWDVCPERSRRTAKQGKHR